MRDLVSLMGKGMWQILPALIACSLLIGLASIPVVDARLKNAAAEETCSALAAGDVQESALCKAMLKNGQAARTGYLESWEKRYGRSSALQGDCQTSGLEIH